MSDVLKNSLVTLYEQPEPSRASMPPVYDWWWLRVFDIIKTPGHNYDGLSMLVKTSKGIIAIVGDVFWSERGPNQDPYASDNAQLKKTRQEVLKLADYIIPGHGAMFKAKK